MQLPPRLFFFERASKINQKSIFEEESMYEEEHLCKFRRVSVKHNSRPLRRMSGAMMDDIIDQNAHINHREACAHPLCVSESGIIAPGSRSLDSAVVL